MMKVLRQQASTIEEFPPLLKSHCANDCCVFGIVEKLLENVREWCLFHADILDTFGIIQVLKLEIYIFL